MYFSELSFCASLLIFLCSLTTGQSLECFTCNVTSSVKDNNDQCKRGGSLGKCSDPAICLSATYLVEDVIAKDKKYTTVKSCYIKSDGNECDLFLKNTKLGYSPSTKIEFAEKCVTCETKGCNEKSDSARVFSTILIFVVSYIFSRLV